MDEKVRTAIELLHEPRSKKREAGAKRLRKLEATEAGRDLLAALEKEVLDARTWATQYQLILALGHAQYEQGLPLLMDLAKRELDATILYMGLGDSIFRLALLSNSIKASLDLIHGFDNFVMTYGAYRALAMLRLIPDDDSINEIIRIASDPKGAEMLKGHPKDETGSRMWVAAACAGWKQELTAQFLSECEKIKDSQLAVAVEHSRRGQYVKWSPY